MAAQPPALVPVPTVPVAPDLLEPLPPFEQNSRDVQAVLTAVGNELGRLEAARQDVIANFFPSTADALLHFFEALLGLPVDSPSVSLADRQRNAVAFMRHIKAAGTGLDWEDAITALIGSGWSYQEHDPADPLSPLAYTILIRIPYSGPVATPAGLAASDGGAGGTLGAGTYFYAITAVTGYGETVPSTPVSITIAASHKVHLAWTAEAAPTTSYRIYRGTTSTNLHLIGTVSPVATHAFDDDGSATPGGAPPTEDSSGSPRAALVQQLARIVTPANLVVNVGTAAGFVIGVSEVGVDAL